MKTVWKLMTNKLEEDTLKNITWLDIEALEVDKHVTSTKLDILEILREWNLIPIELAQEAINTSNEVDRLLSMSTEDQKAEQITIELAKQFKPYWKEALDILKWVNPFPNVKTWVADDYETAIAV